MLIHNIWIAWRSLKRSPVLSALIISGIAVGIAFSTTFAAVRHTFSKHPLPQKESVLRYVRLDSWDPQKEYPGAQAIPTQVTYRDMTALMRSTIPVRQSGSFRAFLYVFPDPKIGRPFREQVRMTYADFFEMFEVPFRYGAGWGKDADEKSQPVVVLTKDVSEKLFGPGNSVGKIVRIEDRDFRVVGVLADWRPSVRFYDLTSNQIAPPEGIFMPLSLFRPMKIFSSGNNDGWGPSGASGIEGFVSSEQCWLQFWVELKDASALAAYRSFLDGYIAEQKRIGRFGRPPKYILSTIRELMDDFRVVPPQTTALLIVGLLFLAVTSVNLIGLLLGKFLARSNEVGVRRALGASRADVFLQHLVECQVVALLGGAIGVLLSLAGLAALNTWMKAIVLANVDRLFQLDAPMLLLALGLSIAAGLVAGLYPAWRTCRIAPAISLKV